MKSGFLLLCGLLLFFAAEGSAQNQNAVGKLGVTLPNEEVSSAEAEMVSADTIQFPNNPVSDFLVVYEKLKGVTLIKDASLLAGGANLSLTLNQPVTKAEAIRLLESTLLLNGYAFIAVDKNSVKVINTAGGKNPRSEGVFLFTSEKDLPEGEVVASYVMPLTYLAAADAVPIFEQFITLHPYGSLVPVPVANQVLITENSTLIRRLIQVRDLVDQPSPEVKSEFVQLHQANADRVVELITQILEKREEKSGGAATAKAATGQGAQPAVPGMPAAQGVTIGGGQSGSVSGDIQLIADPRTNRILIVTRPMNMDYIKKMISEFDIAVDLSEPYEQPLNYVSASDMLPILQDMLKEEGTEATTAGGAEATRTVRGGIGVGGVTGGSAGSSGSSGTTANPADILSEPGEQAAADSIIVGKTRIIADNRANSILVIGQPESKAKVKAILTKLDKRPMQVYLATVIGQLLVNSGDSFAVNVLQRFTGESQSGVNSVGGGRSMITTNTPLMQSAATMARLANVAATNGLPGMQIAAFIGNTLNVYVSALTATGNFRVASRPSVFTANNKKATIFQGQKIAVPTSTVTTLGGGGSATATSGSQQSNIQYQDVVLKIEVVPLINSAREISLQIVETNDTLAKGVNNSTDIGGGVAVPKIDTQKLTTTIIVPDGATILMGGLISQTDNKTSSGIPFISTIPLLGNLFKSTTDDTERRELVVMIQPSVVLDVPELKEVSKTERDLTGFSSKELSPLSMKSAGKILTGSAHPAAAASAESETGKEE
jgi:type II secretion system protein D